MRTFCNCCVSLRGDRSPAISLAVALLCFRAAIGVVLLGLLCGPVRAAGPLPLLRNLDPYGPQTDAESRASAIAGIPRDKMSREALQKVDAVLANIALFRRMPVRVIPCDPDLYLFLVRRPDVVVNIWDVLKLSKLDMQQTGPFTFDVADNAGTAGSVTYLYQSADTHVIFSEGCYEGPIMAKPVTGRTLVVLKTGYAREPDGRYYITSRLDAFMQVDHQAVEWVTKTLQPLVGKVADVNYTQTLAFVGSLSKTAEVDPEGMLRLAKRLTKVNPEARLQFAMISNSIALKANQANESATDADAEVARRLDATTAR
jgi:hypothetical protein